MSHWRVTLTSTDVIVVERNGTAVTRSVDVFSGALTISTLDKDDNLLESRIFAPGAWKEVHYVA